MNLPVSEKQLDTEEPTAVYRQPDALPPSLSSLPSSALSEDLWWNIPTALGVWFLSVLLMVVFQAIFLFAYALYEPKFIADFTSGHLTITAPIAILSLVGTFIAQILTLIMSWFIVTGMGRRPFLQTLGWNWHPRFGIPHAIALSLLAMGWSALCSKMLPHKETDLDLILALGLSTRIVVALLATVAAPMVEEVIYRGLLYPVFEKKLNTAAAVSLVTFLFWLVHVPQYWKSPAVLMALLGLSLALTIVRAYTGKLLPCVVIHFIFNGIQAVAIVLVDPTKKESLRAALESTAAALSVLF